MRNPAEASRASRAPEDGGDPTLHLAAMLDRLDELIAICRAARRRHEDRNDPREGCGTHAVLAPAGAEELARLREVVAATPDLRAEVIEELRDEIHAGAPRTDSWRIAGAVLSEFAL